MEYKYLFSPCKIGNIEIKNRIVLTAAGDSYGDDSGSITEREHAYLVERAKGGVGLIAPGGMSVDNELCGVSEPRQPRVTDPRSHDSLEKVIRAVHNCDAKFMVQLMHQGRQAYSRMNRGQQPVAPSAIKEADFLEMPRELSISEIKYLIEKFIEGAKTVYDLGADGVELHGAHGYIFHQFMSSRANHRTDEYGGSFENRMRFTKEIIEGILAIKPSDRFLAIRMNGTDQLEGGLTVEDGTKIALYVESLGVDLIDLSYSTYSNSFMSIEPAIFEEGCRSFFVKPIKERLKVPVLAVNQIKRPETAEKILAEGVCDFVGMARPTMADPWLPNKALAGKNTVRCCISCNNCLDTAFFDGVECSMNPYAGREYRYNDETIVKNGNGRLIAVIGGGPGGMQSAITAAKRGFEVKLFEKGDKLGGALLLAGKGKGKDKILWSLNGMENELRELGVEVILNKEISKPEQLTHLNPYAVVVAVGAAPANPKISGLENIKVYQAHDILRHGISFSGKQIAIVGSGMTGLETAEVLMEGGNRIVLYDMLDEIAKGGNNDNRITAIDYLSRNGVQFRTLHKLLRVEDGKLVFENLSNGETVVENPDVVVLSLGVKPIKSIEKAFADSVPRLVPVGDCAGEGQSTNEVREGYNAASAMTLPTWGRIYHATRDGLIKLWDI